MAEKKPIEAGLISRLTTGVKFILTGKTPEWFGPGDPLDPVAQDEAQGRQFDFPVLANVTRSPRDGEGVTFSQMRTLSETCDVLRLVIETRKDQIAKMQWTIKPKDPKATMDARCKAVQDLLQSPDREHDWSTWLRMLLEDLFVIDAPAVYVRPTVGGQVYSFDPVDGATIKRVIDQAGRTPAAPQVAYQQILKGLPAVDYSTDELIYMPRNPRTHKVYGYSPVEQIVFTVNVALRRSLHQLQYYTEGNVPEALIGVPETWNPDQIAQFQKYWDSLLEGNQAAKSHAKFVPGGLKFQETKSGVTKDEFDEWLARIVCYAFSVPSTPFTKQVNRATAETAQEAALEEGLTPIMQWIQNLANVMIGKFFGYPDLGFFWETEDALQPEIQAKITDTKLKNATMTINEARALDGLDPVPDGNELMLYTAQGAVLLKDVINPPEPPPPPTIVQAAPGTDANAPPGTVAEEPGKATPDKPPAKEAMSKAKKHMPHIDRERAAIVGQRDKLEKILKSFFKKQSVVIASQVIDALGKMSADDEVKLLAILKQIDLSGWSDLADDVQGILEIVGRDGGAEGLLQIGMSEASEKIVNLVNAKAVEYSKERSAELVGMKWVDGELVENPNPEWAITDSTREFLRGDVQAAMESGMSNDDLADLIADNYAFSDARAEMIARTETAFADVQGNLTAYKESGVVQGKTGIAAPTCCEFCQELDGVTVGIDEDFPNEGGDGPPLHSQCVCDILPETELPDAQAGGDDPQEGDN